MSKAPNNVLLDRRGDGAVSAPKKKKKPNQSARPSSTAKAQYDMAPSIEIHPGIVIDDGDVCACVRVCVCVCFQFLYAQPTCFQRNPQQRVHCVHPQMEAARTLSLAMLWR